MSSPFIYGSNGATSLVPGGVTLPSTNGNTVQIKPASTSSSYAVTLPAAQAAGSYTNDGSGNLSFIPMVPLSEVGIANGVASLNSSGKIPTSQLPSTVFEYQGAWNPTTNTPTLSDATGTSGYVYRVSTAYSGTVSGLADPSMTNFQVGNLIIYSSTVWQQSSAVDGVVSVNGAQGAVTVNAISQLTGDGTAGPATQSQSQAFTLATVNSNVGSFTNATITVNGKGLITAASNGTSAITSLSVATANGLAGTSSGGTTPIVTLSTTVTGVLQGNGTAISAATTTGTGSVVLAASPTLVTPALGTPSAAVLTNATGLPLTSGVTGTLPIVNGGTNSATALTNNKVMVSTGGAIVESATTTTQLSYLDATSSIQTQLNSKAGGVPTDIAPTSFSASNNVSSATNVTGLNFPSASIGSFEALVQVYVSATTSLRQCFSIQGNLTGSGNWDITQTTSGDNSGFIFTITSAGQIQYTNLNYAGFVSATIRFRAITLTP